MPTIDYPPDWLHIALLDLADMGVAWRSVHIARIEDYIANEIQRGIVAYRKEQESQLHTTDGC